MEANPSSTQAFNDANVSPSSGSTEDGTAKAMRMMLAMGYRRGEALGKRMQSKPEDEGEVEEEEEEEDDDETSGPKAGEPDLALPPEDEPDSLDTDEEQAIQRDRAASQAREEDEYLSGGISSSPFAAVLSKTSATEPLRPDQRWLGLNRRAGIGMIPATSPAVSRAIQAKASSSSIPASTASVEADFRSRISREHQDRHDANLLSRARKTLIELDKSANTQYSPLWLDAELYHVLSGHTSSNLDTGTIDERMQKDAAFREAVELLQWVFGSGEEDKVKEAQLFCDLKTKEQLELVLGSLRKQHCYCLFCGCQYSDQDDLAKHCPGEMEDDHD